MKRETPSCRADSLASLLRQPGMIGMFVKIVRTAHAWPIGSSGCD